MNFEKYIDISPLIHSASAVFPEDQIFCRNVHLDFNKGDHLGLSSITTTLHIGAHADSTNHYHKSGVGIAELSLQPYMGLCQVIDLSHKNELKNSRIKMEDISNLKIEAPRILFKTDSFLNPDQWQNNFTSLSPELIKYLHKKSVILIGIDTPSVDPYDSKLLESHQALFDTDMRVLEGLVLNNVTNGLFNLVALPLNIKDADASPVRAILLPI